MTGIEPALSAWESVQFGPSIWPDLRNGLFVSDRESPRFTRVNGPLMARRLDHAEGRPSAFQAGHIPSCYGSCERCALSLVAAACRWSLLLLSPRRRPSGSKPTRTLQGMARVRSGKAAAWPVVSDRSGRRGSGIKRDFACTFTRHFHLCSLSCRYSRA